MALERIFDLPAATVPLTGTEILEIEQGGNSAQCTAQDIADLGSGGGGTNRNTVTALSIASGVVDIDCSLGDYFTLALTTNVTSISFSNLPAADVGASLLVRVTQDSTPRTLAWPASFRWPGGADGVVSTSSGAIDLLALTSFDQGTTWDATLANAFAA